MNTSEEFLYETINTNQFTIDTIISPSDKYLRQALLEVHKYKCFYSRDPITEETFHVEHIHPSSKGGKDCIGNYVPASIGMNMLKLANYDDHGTKLIQAKNRLTFAPKVLKRYLQLKNTNRKQVTKALSLNKSRDSRMKTLNGVSYLGDEYIDMIIEKSKYAIYKNVIGLPSQDGDRYKIELKFNDSKLIKDIYKLTMVNSLNRRVVCSDLGVIIPEYQNCKTNGTANMIGGIGYSEEDQKLDITVAIPSKVDKYPVNSDIMIYFQQLSRKIESIMNITDNQ